MKKFVSIFLSISLLISTFDIIDVADITLGSAPIFSSDDMSANQNQDDVQSDFHRTSAPALVFHIVESQPIPKPEVVAKVFITTPNPIQYNKYSVSLYRPPCKFV